MMSQQGWEHSFQTRAGPEDLAVDLVDAAGTEDLAADLVAAADVVAAAEGLAVVVGLETEEATRWPKRHPARLLARQYCKW